MKSKHSIIHILLLIVLYSTAITVWAQDSTPYPGPLPTPTAANSYPGAAPTVTPPPPTPYPLVVNTPIPTVISIVGDDNPVLAPTAVATLNTPVEQEAPAADTPVRNIFIMWAGFLVTGLIFVTGIYGTIVMYTRRRE